MLLLIRHRYFINRTLVKDKSFSKLFSSLNSKYIRKYKMTLPKFREDPVIQKLKSPEFQAIFTPELEALSALFKKYNFEIRIAGGAVRDILMGMQPTDLDFATTATPQQMKDMFTEENVRMINMKGEKHGTITPRINDKENFEVTTLRIDVVTDGRHADVIFTTDWMLDANRRDLTINSMFLALDGSVYDYFYGYEDLKKRRIAFVGDPDTRIKEDYLRILRYFRFYGNIADQPDNHEDSTLHTISENINGLERISGERIWTELKKILECKFASELVKTMLHVGVAKYIGLPEKPNEPEFDALCSRSSNHKLHPITKLSALLHNPDDAINLHSRMKFSAYERDLALFLTQNREDKIHPNPLLYYQQLILNSKVKSSNTKEWIVELLKYRNDTNLLTQLQDWNPPKFPVNGNMLKSAGITGGRLIGQVMKELRVHWAENDFNLSSEELLKQAPQILSDIEDKIQNKNR